VNDVCDLTVDDAAAWLDPPIGRAVLAALITDLRIRPTGTRRRAKGRPAYTYDAGEIQLLHAGVVHWLTPPG
jgi:hypothetical protein